MTAGRCPSYEEIHSLLLLRRVRRTHQFLLITCPTHEFSAYTCFGSIRSFCPIATVRIRLAGSTAFHESVAFRRSPLLAAPASPQRPPSRSRPSPIRLVEGSSSNHSSAGSQEGEIASEWFPELASCHPSIAQKLVCGYSKGISSIGTKKSWRREQNRLARTRRAGNSERAAIGLIAIPRDLCEPNPRKLHAL